MSYDITKTTTSNSSQEIENYCIHTPIETIKNIILFLIIKNYKYFVLYFDKFAIAYQHRRHKYKQLVFASIGSAHEKW